MTILESALSRKPVGWLTVLGVLLLPAVIGGVLVAALYNPTERLENMSAAIVNLDEPVTIDGQYTPLGRQLAAGLVDGSDDLDSNLTWVLSNEDDASEGLRNGTYQAVVTIPEEFSAAATSSGQALSGAQETAERATIEVTTAPDALVVDQAITTQVANVAAATMGDMLSEATLSNLLIGFTTMGDQLGDAADGARQLASGAGEARTGADQLADGATQAADGVAQLGDGVSQLATGAAASAGGAHQLAGGATALAQGLRGDGSGTGLADGAQQLAGGAQSLADGLRAGAAQAEQGLVPAELTNATGGALRRSAELATLVGDQCTYDPADPLDVPDADLCSALSSFVDPENQNSLLVLTGTADGYAQGLAENLPGQVAAGYRDAATGAQSLADGASGLADGAAQSAAGADELAAGASALGSGLDQLASGAQQAAAGVPPLHDGVSQLATGVGALGDGIGELAGGANELAGGLEQAVDAVPSYGEREAQDLASVVADPVGTSGTEESLFGASAVPLLATAVLWFGALGTFLALRAVSARALTSRRASVLLAGGTLLPAAVIGALQGALVAGVLQLAGGYEAGTFWGLLGVSVLTGVAFAAVHQALMAVFGGGGRWVAAIVGAVAIAASIVSTIPRELTGVKAVLPTTPAFDAFLAVIAGTGAGGAAIAGLVIWAVLAFLVSTLAVTRRRSVSAKELLEPALA
ncbi:YhgE/Pip domain-containing protein [Microbacterium sp. Marseille-Q6965]|uniref:YhgE/Pip domain-containing protein n=1 Tax=Microbacterium sp. Marseille-Q6965 TaxID=2965072 RepID=UPI0021B74130|nr:YhgE/Pip family protein [Microbacterium sp. Marseille-Q6965]